MQDLRSYNRLVRTVGSGGCTEKGRVYVYVRDYATQAQRGPYHYDGIDMIWTNQGNLQDGALGAGGSRPCVVKLTYVPFSYNSIQVRPRDRPYGKRWGGEGGEITYRCSISNEWR